MTDNTENNNKISPSLGGDLNRYNTRLTGEEPFLSVSGRQKELARIVVNYVTSSVPYSSAEYETAVAQLADNERTSIMIIKQADELLMEKSHRRERSFKLIYNLGVTSQYDSVKSQAIDSISDSAINFQTEDTKFSKTIPRYYIHEIGDIAASSRSDKVHLNAIDKLQSYSKEKGDVRSPLGTLRKIIYSATSNETVKKAEECLKVIQERYPKDEIDNPIMESQSVIDAYTLLAIKSHAFSSTDDSVKIAMDALSLIREKLGHIGSSPRYFNLVRVVEVGITCIETPEVYQEARRIVDEYGSRKIREDWDSIEFDVNDNGVGSRPGLENRTHWVY